MAPRFDLRLRFQQSVLMIALSACCPLAACLLTSSLDSLGNGNAAGADASSDLVDGLDALPDAADSQQTESSTDVDYQIAWASTAPPFVGDCEAGAWAGVPSVAFRGFMTPGYNNSDEDCRLMWSTDGVTTHVYGCCKVSDLYLTAIATQDAPMGANPVWMDDEIELHFKGDTDKALSANSDKFFMNIGDPSVTLPVYYPDGASTRMLDAGIVVRVKLLGNDGGSVNPGTPAAGYVIEWQLNLGFAVSAGGQIGRCDILVTDRDQGDDTTSHLAFNSDNTQNVNPGGWGVCQFMPQ
jgi:hypothetical protein